MPFDPQKERPSEGGSLNDNIDSLERKKGRGHPRDPEKTENPLVCLYFSRQFWRERETWTGYNVTALMQSFIA